MAIKPAPKKTTQLNTWEQELADQAAASMAQEQNASTGQFYSFKNAELSFEGVKFPGNEVAVIILDGIMENVFYEGEYDSANPSAPNCFAFGRNEKEMAPHEIVVEPVHDTCAGCPNNEWGSAEKGRGKACRNTRRLAVILAGNFVGGAFQPITDADHFETAKIGYMRLPVTSVKGYAGYVKSIGNAHSRPPHGMITHVKVAKDDDTLFKVEFDALAKVPNNLMEIIMERHRLAKGEIDFPYQPMEERAAPAPKRGKPAPAPAKRGALPAKRSKY